MPEAAQLCCTAGLSQRNLPSFSRCVAPVSKQVLWTEQCHAWGTCLDVVRVEICTQCLLFDEFYGTWNQWCHEATGFGHVSSKTCCCRGYYLAFIRLDKLHVHMATSPGEKTIPSVLPICVDADCLLGAQCSQRQCCWKERKRRAMSCFAVCWCEICTARLV